MEKIILKSQNEEELKEMIERSLTLQEDETYRVKILKYPKKILFVNIQGEYEVEIIKKSELENLENKFSKKEKKQVKENIENNSKDVEEKKIISKPNSSKKNNFKNEIKKSTADATVDKIRGFFKEFIVNTKLDIKIIAIKKENSDKYLVLLDGKDMRYIIGEKGNTLNNFEYLISVLRKFKNIKIVVDSNNYKEKREISLRELARKKGKIVLSTGNAIKLNPMSARERKIIHEEVSFMHGLKTESFGEEPKRYLVIKKFDNKIK